MSGELVPRRMLPAARSMGMQTYPDRAGGVNITPNASSNAYGSWTRISPNGGLPWDLLIHGLQIAPATAPFSTNLAYWQLQLAIAGQTSEFPISVFRTHGIFFTSAAARNYFSPIWLPYPLLVRARQTISARAGSDFGSFACGVSINFTRVDDESVID